MKNAWMLVLAGLLSAGCAGVRVSPSAAEVRTVAFVALSMNVPFRDTEAKKGETASRLKGFESSSSDTFILGDNPDALRGILEKAQVSFSSRFGGMRGWTFLSQDALAAHPAFQAAMASPGWARSPHGREGAPNLLPTGLEDLTVRIVHLGRPASPGIRQKLAALARDLGVDAVALVDLDMAYTLTGNVVWDLAEGRPDVAARLAVVDRSGETVVQALHTTRFITDPLALFRRQKTLVALDIGKDPDPAKISKAYQKAVDSSAVLLVEELEKKISPRLDGK